MEEVTPSYRFSQERADAANEHCLRIEGVIDLASAIECDQFFRPNGVHEEFIEELLDGWDAHCDESMKPLFDALDGIDETGVSSEEIASCLAIRRLNGYVVQFALPVFMSATENSTTYSWGRYRTKWIYADLFEDAWRSAVEWAKRHRAKAIQETAAKATS